jgi:hypothetical protein
LRSEFLALLLVHVHGDGKAFPEGGIADAGHCDLRCWFCWWFWVLIVRRMSRSIQVQIAVPVVEINGREVLDPSSSSGAMISFSIPRQALECNLVDLVSVGLAGSGAGWLVTGWLMRSQMSKSKECVLLCQMSDWCGVQQESE